MIVVVLLIAGVLIFKNQKENKMTDQINIQNDSKEITLSEVANHSTQSDCWIAIEGGVYDVTDFISTHPGGDQILQGCGKDTTGMFNSRPTDGTSHSGNARNILSKYRIGDLAK